MTISTPIKKVTVFTVEKGFGIRRGDEADGKIHQSSNLNAPTELHTTDISKLQSFGRFHCLQYFWICLPVIMTSMLHVNYVFIAEVNEYRCLVPECESPNSSVHKPEWWPPNVDEKCYRPVLNEESFDLHATNQTCSNSSFVEVVTKCDKWTYESNNSIVSAFNLGCESWKASLVGTLHNAGMMVSMFLTGWLSDSFGRKPAVIICSIGGFVGMFKIFVTNFYAYLTIEFLESVISSGLYSVGVILMIEVGGETKRVLAGVIFAYAIYMGEIVYASLAMALKYWKYIILAMNSPLLIFVTYTLLLKESTRWQMIRGKMEDAKQTFKTISRLNKNGVSDEEIDAISDEKMRSQFNVELQVEKESFKDIIGSKEIMIRIVVTSICFFTSSFLYYGLVVNSIYLPGDKYVNFIMVAVISFPGDVIAFYALNKFGRRATLQGGYVVCAAFLIAMPWLKVILFLVGKLGVVVCFTSIYTYAMELFPTSVRGSLFGWGSTVARVGGMLAPLTPLLVKTFQALPSILFATTAIVSAISVTFTPETKYLPLFDTIAQVNTFKTNEKAAKENTKMAHERYVITTK